MWECNLFTPDLLHNCLITNISSQFQCPDVSFRFLLFSSTSSTELVLHLNPLLLLLFESGFNSVVKADLKNYYIN